MRQPDTDIPYEPLPTLWPWLVLSAAVALWVALSRPYHQEQNGDSLMPVFMSLFGWTPYFWGCTRLGMLLALLATPFQSPLVNLVVQSWLALFALFASMFLLARYAYRRPAWPLAGAVGVIFLLLIPSARRMINFTLEQSHYPVGVALGFGALLVISWAVRDQHRWGALLLALLLLGLAQWVNQLIVVLLVLVVGLHALLVTPTQSVGSGWLAALRVRLFQPECLVSLTFLIPVYLLGHFLQPLYYHGNDPYLAGGVDPSSLGFQPLASWPEALARSSWVFLGEFWNHPVGFSAYFLLALPGFVLALYRRQKAVLFAALVLVLSCLIFSIPVTGTVWARMNDYSIRYFFPLYFCGVVGTGLFVLHPLSDWLTGPQGRLYLRVVLPVLIFLTAGVAYGLPSKNAVREGIFGMQEGKLHPISDDLLALRCSHICGKYHSVVPITFLTNVSLHARGDTRRVWPISHYMTDCAIWEKWAAQPLADLRIGIPLDSQGKHHELSEAFLREFAPLRYQEFTVVERREHAQVMLPTALVLADPTHPESHGIYAAFHEGFYPWQPQADGSQLRWCLSQGRMTLTNPSDRVKTVTFSMQLTAPVYGPWTVWIEGPTIHRALDLFTAGRQTFTVQLPPRTAWTYTISSNAKTKRLKHGSWMQQHFGIVNFQLSEYGS